MFKNLKIKKIKFYSKISSLIFFLERTIIKSVYRLFNLHPSSEPFLSGDTFRKISTYQYKGDTLKIFKPEIIFMNTHVLSELYEQINLINHPFILISHHSDHLVDRKFLSIANNSNLIHWYAQNCIIKHKKISNIPIGLEDRWRHNNGIIRDFVNLRNKKLNKIPRILYGFHIRNNPSVRKKAHQILSSLSTADHYRNNPRKYRKKLAKYHFVACPEGNGIDTHRMWEALYLNVIPIIVVKNGNFLFQNLPVLKLNKWEELAKYSETDLSLIYQKNQHKFKHIKFLWIDYWKKHINKKFNKYKDKSIKNLI